MRTILVATDFSTSSMNAINYAADMALNIGANILLLHVCQVPYTYSEMRIVLEHEDIMEQAAQQLKDIKEDLSKKLNAAIHIKTLLQFGSFFHELREVCDCTKPYAVVLGSQGKSALERVLFGTNSVYAMKHLAWPIIAVPQGVSFSQIKKIGLACDFEKVTETIPLNEVRTLAHDFNATMYVLNTGSKDEFNPDLVFESTNLKVLLKDIEPQFHFITGNDKDQGIINFAEQHHLDLLVVFPKQHHLLEKIIHSSYTKQLVLHCHVPVMALQHSPA